MKLRIFATLSIIVLCLEGTSCSLNNQAPTPWQRTVNEFSSLIHARVPDHLLQEDAIKVGGEFDVNEYFSVLQHLSMQPDYVLDYAYHYEVMGGEPVIYARHIDTSPYRTYSEYEEAEHGGVFPGWPAIEHGFTDRVQVDGSTEGFFELIVLRTMGGQFYQFWHAGNNDHTIICDEAGLEAILGAPQTLLGEMLPPDVQKEARSLELEPIIELGEDTALVKVVVFTKWGGFMRASYTISRSFPHDILQEDTEMLIEYDCGWNY